MQWRLASISIIDHDINQITGEKCTEYIKEMFGNFMAKQLKYKYHVSMGNFLILA